MLEALISVVAVIGCWLLIVGIPKDDLSLKGYVGLIFLGLVGTYFLIRFVHWAWDTPLAFFNR
jgi:hypothetical protein